MTDITSAASSDLFKLLHDSPKKLVLSLQQSQPPSELSKPKFAMTERRAAIKCGKLRGRKLLEALEGAREEVNGLHGREEICSVCSSVLIQSGDANSSCSCCSSLLDMHDYNHGKVYLSSSSSSATTFSTENVEREREIGVAKMGGFVWGGVERWMWRMCWLSIVLLFLALGLISLREFGMEEYDEYIIPT
ncbi:hypothetical protein COCNU_scaffold004463G000010 [Cocos nucifera]|nr:hypothetical protein [Cocos nucifera]